MSILLLGIVTKTELYFLEKDKQKNCIITCTKNWDNDEYSPPERRCGAYPVVVSNFFYLLHSWVSKHILDFQNQTTNATLYFPWKIFICGWDEVDGHHFYFILVKHYTHVYIIYIYTYTSCIKSCPDKYLLALILVKLGSCS